MQFVNSHHISAGAPLEEGEPDSLPEAGHCRMASAYFAVALHHDTSLSAIISKNTDIVIRVRVLVPGRGLEPP